MNATEDFLRSTDITYDTTDVKFESDLQPGSEECQASSLADGNGRGLCGFLSELRRRKVCRAATSYAVVLWLVYQVVELVAPELRLPDWTLRFVILVGLLGFPVTLVLSWMLEITPQGVVIDSDGNVSSPAASQSTSSRPLDRIIDCSLVLAAAVIATQLAIGAVGTATASQILDGQRIVVAPFRVSVSGNAEGWSEGLIIELQHELNSQTHMIVVAPKDPYESKDSVVLTGALSGTESKVYVTVTLIDTDTHIVAWSRTFECTGGDSGPTPAKIARRIVAVLPIPDNEGEST